MNDYELKKYLFQLGIGVPPGGEVFFVGKKSTKAWEWIRGKVGTWHAYNAIADALKSCEASRIDTIVALPYHTETITAASQLDFDTAGCRLVGIGIGASMPKLDYTVAAGELAIGAADVLIKNINFHSNVTAVLKGIDVEAAGDNFVIEDCRFDVETTTTDEFNHSIDIAAGANGGIIRNCYFDMGLGGAVSAIHLNGASTNHRILDNFITGDYSTANITGSTAASTVLEIGRNILQNGTGSNIGAQPCIELNGNSTGIIHRNMVACNLTTKAASIVAAQCFLFENYYNEDVSGAATGGIIGTASADD